MIPAWADTLLLSTIAALGAIGTGLGWRIYDKVQCMDRKLAAVIQKIGGIEA